MKQKTYPKWKRLGQKTLYEGRSHIMGFETELPSGEHVTYEVEYSTSCAVAVLIKTADNKIIITYQYRFPLDEWIYDLPGGGKQENETVEEAAIRECREEVGMAPKKLEKLATFYPNPGRASWPAHVFYCESYVSSKIELNDPSENVETVYMPVADFKKLIDAQKIVDPSLLIGWHTACSKGYITVS